ncbi:hypothetical protein PTSG_07923 [Salpingoeca rosetta]|uniref:Cysteine/serine-rich nuclear protein N-terminal domain-containing protein n=1 Tax=Salpingoeca rosetta (strain ATCC 50818 / BSB-021) TaxID=946362 RepID=F2UGQ5_SALR5|nr:uncharacterized protein PTSG_07923 [Salpingoeca rosetta]EGD75805.1 hypothetical protein PTSG_07923 [Salpingoeca rosetta]|eukprot:XP_004991726.1 hypothetical protein PTSG_07923 [Salpingoeca rosetta]
MAAKGKKGGSDGSGSAASSPKNQGPGKKNATPKQDKGKKAAVGKDKRRVSFADASQAQLFTRGINESVVPFPATSVPIGLNTPICKKERCAGCADCTLKVPTKKNDGGEELDFRLGPKKRRQLLKQHRLSVAKGLLQLNSNVASEREKVFCKCKGKVCNPDTCACAKAGIGCHRQPEGGGGCLCSLGVCNNPQEPTYESNDERVLENMARHIPAARAVLRQLRARKKRLEQRKARVRAVAQGQFRGKFTPAHFLKSDTAAAAAAASSSTGGAAGARNKKMRRAMQQQQLKMIREEGVSTVGGGQAKQHQHQQQQHQQQQEGKKKNKKNKKGRSNGGNTGVVMTANGGVQFVVASKKSKQAVQLGGKRRKGKRARGKKQRRAGKR